MVAPMNTKIAPLTYLLVALFLLQFAWTVPCIPSAHADVLYVAQSSAVKKGKVAGGIKLLKVVAGSTCPAKFAIVLNTAADSKGTRLASACAHTS